MRKPHILAFSTLCSPEGLEVHSGTIQWKITGNKLGSLIQSTLKNTSFLSFSLNKGGNHREGSVDRNYTTRSQQFFLFSGEWFFKHSRWLVGAENLGDGNFYVEVSIAANNGESLLTAEVFWQYDMVFQNGSHERNSEALHADRALLHAFLNIF